MPKIHMTLNFQTICQAFDRTSPKLTFGFMISFLLK
jgi:hypothetical protein